MTRRRDPDTDRERAAPRGTAARVIRVGNYIVERRLGTGGQADVFLARDVVLRRLVALKVLHRGSSQDVRGLEEARLIATLDHPNIVRLYHVERAEGVWYMAMEYVDGGNLELRVARVGPLEPVRAIKNAFVVADALAHAHKIGVIHRDVKPQNLLETRAGVLKLADFGLAGLRTESLENTARPVRLVGTPQYLAPEMWLGEPASAKSDMYGLGATLYFMLTGQPPFQAKNVRELRAAHLDERPAIPGDVPAAAAEVILRCMAKSPTDRPTSAQSLQEELQDTLSIITGERRRGRRAGGGRAAPSEPAVYSQQSRLQADAAALRLPVFAQTRERLEETLAQTPPLVVFHGPSPDTLKPVLRSVVDVGQRRFYVAARAALGPQSPPLGASLLEQLHLGQGPMPAWHDRVVTELMPEAGGSPTLPTMMEIDLRRPITPAEATDLVELGRRAEGKSVMFLVTCDTAVAPGLLSEMEASGYGFLLRHVSMPELTDTERAEFIRTWTYHATGDRLRWTDDAIRLVRYYEVTKRKPLSRLMHNSILVALGSSTRLLTSWTVMGADAHAEYIQSPADIQPAWRERPLVWPREDLLPTLLALRTASR
ncbi:MAG TPA: serine/threonine-protein kinase [Haliangiales bacterium]|nr:serine/threonine-protein kinase [Haliangiales bacterium]